MGRSISSLFSVTTMFAVLLMSACSTTPYDPQSLESNLAESDLAMGSSVETISHFDLDGWEYLDKYHMVIKTRRDEKYLVSFSHRCSTFTRNSVPIFEFRTNSLSKFDNIKIADMVGLGSFTETCPIEDIVKLNSIDYQEPLEEQMEE